MNASQPELQAELAKLLQYVAGVATAIRMNSMYSPEYRATATSSRDVMWLSESLYNFDQLGRAILIGDREVIGAACDHLIQVYARYKTDTSGHDSKATFDRYSAYFSLDDALDLIRAIKTKCSAAVLH
ncbi:MAG TPA: hypothetical protein VIT92_07840 [Burkholderiaceae bacterium]